MHDRVSELSDFDAAAPRELRPIVARCLERVPARRFESASDLAMALRALLSGSTPVGVGRRPRTRGKSLAVLPFVNAGADPATEYLTDGITESIINSVSQLSGLRVVPRSLVFRYKGLQADPSTVGVALNVRTILTGRVSQQGDYLTIQAELVDTATESQFWGEHFRPRLSELPNVQQDIAWQISEALRLKLTGAQKKKLRKRAAVNPLAYQEYLRGRHFFNAWSPDGFRLGARALRARDRTRPDLRPRLRRARRHHRLDVVLRAHPAEGRLPARPRRRRASHRARSRSRRGVRDARRWAACSIGGTGTTPSSSSERSIALNPKLASVRAFYRHPARHARPARGVDRRGPHRARARSALAARQHERRLGVLLRRPAGTRRSRSCCIRRILHRGQNADEPHSLMMASYEHAGTIRGGGAHRRRATPASACRSTARRSLAAWRTGGRAGVLAGAAGRARSRRAGDRCRWSTTTTRVVLTSLGRHDEAMAHLDRARRAAAGQRGLPRRRAGAGCAARPPRLRRAAHADWGAPSAHGFSTAYSVDVIGTGTPRRRRAAHDRSLQLLDLDPLSLRQDRSAATIASIRECRRRRRRCGPRRRPPPARPRRARGARSRGSRRGTARESPARPRADRSAAATRRSTPRARREK